MTTKIDPVSTIIASFSIPELSAIADLSTRPTYQSLLTAQTELNTNAASIDTTQGTRIHGLLILTMPTTIFNEMVGFDNAVPPVQIQHPAPARALYHRTPPSPLHAITEKTNTTSRRTIPPTKHKRKCSSPHGPTFT